MAEAARPDLVLMDINLESGGDGIDAARQIRERQAVPVVFLTAYAEPGVLARAAAAAPYGYLLKPFQLRELNATVQMAIVRREEERKTERAQRRLQLAVEAARLSVLELAEGGSELRWSGVPLDGELGGLAEAVELGQLLVGLDDAGRKAFDRLMQNGEPIDLTCRWQDSGTSDTLRPEPRWVELHARHFAAERLIMGMMRDVSAKIESEDPAAPGAGRLRRHQRVHPVPSTRSAACSAATWPSAATPAGRTSRCAPPARGIPLRAPAWRPPRGGAGIRRCPARRPSTGAR